MVNAEEIGKKIAQRRKENGLTQKELAARLSVTDKAVSKWERGINFPEVTILEPLATELDTTVIAFLISLMLLLEVVLFKRLGI
ncbi:MAG: helix-turn-helix transcriptional regulator [Agathobacter sp.]|nr:helix-turn-helix transcriptional regulator [Agathobacter sp.]